MVAFLLIHRLMELVIHLVLIDALIALLVCENINRWLETVFKCACPAGSWRELRHCFVELSVKQVLILMSPLGQIFLAVLWDKDPVFIVDRCYILEMNASFHATINVRLLCDSALIEHSFCLGQRHFSFAWLEQGGLGWKLASSACLWTNGNLFCRKTRIACSCSGWAQNGLLINVRFHTTCWNLRPVLEGILTRDKAALLLRFLSWILSLLKRAQNIHQNPFGFGLSTARDHNQLLWPDLRN